MLGKILAAQGMHYSSHVHRALQSFHFDIHCFILLIDPLSYIGSTQESSYHLRVNLHFSLVYKLKLDILFRGVFKSNWGKVNKKVPAGVKQKEVRPFPNILALPKSLYTD